MNVETTAAPETPAPDAQTPPEHEEPQAPHSEYVDAPLVIGVGVAGFLLIVVTVIFVYQYYHWYTIRLKNERATASGYEAPMIATRDEMQSQLGLGWVDPDTAVLYAPLDAAAGQVVDRYSQRREGGGGR